MSVVFHDSIIQGTPEWLALRNDFITGTDAYKLLKGKSVDDILDAKRNAAPFKGTRSTRRGHRLEPEAIAITSAIKEVEITDMGFITNTKYPRAGFSPDGLIGTDGIAECKAFNKERHFENQKKPEIQIIAQIQWGLFVTERQWGYLILYNPDLPPEDAIFIKLIKRNEAAMRRFEELLSR